MVDITGGAPELNPHFRWLVEQLRGSGRHVMDRCNLTVLETATLRARRVLRRASAWSSSALSRTTGQLDTDRQRGEGVYERRSRRCGGSMRSATATVKAVCGWCW